MTRGEDDGRRNFLVRWLIAPRPRTTVLCAAPCLSAHGRSPSTIKRALNRTACNLTRTSKSMLPSRRNCAAAHARALSLVESCGIFWSEMKHKSTVITEKRDSRTALRELPVGKRGLGQREGRGEDQRAIDPAPAVRRRLGRGHSDPRTGLPQRHSRATATILHRDRRSKGLRLANRADAAAKATEASPCGC